MSFFRILAISVIVAAPAGSAYAQTVAQPVNIDIPHITQDTDQWCWLAVAEMIMHQQMGFSDQQCELIERWDNQPTGNCCGDLRQCRRTAIDLAEVAELLGSEDVHSRRTMPILPHALYSLIMSDMPVVARIRTSDITHAVVIRGMRWRGSTAILLVNDPSRDAPHEVPYRDFAMYWLGSLIITR